MAIQRWHAQTEQVRNLTHDVREIVFRLLEPKEMAFKAGQFVSFEVTNQKTGRMVSRPYSILSPPSQRRGIELLLNLVSGGPGSTYLFSLKEGDATQFKGPAGNFYIRDEPTKDLLFVATGTGIVPIWSMLHDRFERGGTRSITLLWGLRGQKDLYYQDELRALTARHANFTSLTTLSRPEPGWTGTTGRVTKLVEERVSSVSNLAVYLCGNSGMIKDVSDIINKKGLCPIYREKYYDDTGAPDD
ncbi:MAG: FAD-binding oxidoreductase [Nitrospiraceae bacterium]